MDALAKLIGSNIRALRKERGLSQSELALQLQTDATAVSRWERGLVVPSVEGLFKLSQALRVPMYEILPTLNDPARERMLKLRTELSEVIRRIEDLDQMEAIAASITEILDLDEDGEPRKRAKHP
ncbi:helix-turn-helix protein [compost metagenome]